MVEEILYLPRPQMQEVGVDQLHGVISFQLWKQREKTVKILCAPQRARRAFKKNIGMSVHIHAFVRHDGHVVSFASQFCREACMEV